VRRPVLPALAAGQLVLANVCSLQEGELILSHGVPPLLRFRREGRNLPIRRFHNQRRPSARMLMCQENRRVVGAADVLFAPPRMWTIVLSKGARSLPIQFGPFLLCKKTLCWHTERVAARVSRSR